MPKKGRKRVNDLIRWFWQNIFILGILVIEGALCAAQHRRRHFPARWLAFTGLLLAASSLLTLSWQWDGDVIVRQNVVINSAWRALLVCVSACQMWACFEMDLWNAAFVSQVAAACQTAQFGVYKLLEALLLGEEAQRAPGGPSVLINLAVLLAAGLTVYFLFGRGKRLSFRSDRRTRYVILLAVFLNLSEQLLNGVLYTTDANANFGVPMVAMRLYSFLFNFVTLYMLYNLIIRRAMERERDMQRSLLRSRESQYRFSRELIDRINLKAHDLKKQLNYLKGSTVDQDAFLAEMETLADTYDATFHTENDALNVVLTEKSMLCLARQIPFSFTGSGKGMDFLRGIDLYTLFANLLDNAIEASMHLEKEKRNIHLAVKQQFDFISIHCANRFSGRLIEQGGVLFTIKADREEHGYGFRSMEEIAERYDGSVSHHTDGDLFVVNILLPRHGDA